MAEHKYTPGPWLVSVSPIGKNPDICIHRNKFGIVADIPGGPREMREANADLIAAAPALAMAWSMVPEEIQQRIFDALHKPDTAWMERAITRAIGEQ